MHDLKVNSNARTGLYLHSGKTFFLDFIFATQEGFIEHWADKVGTVVYNKLVKWSLSEYYISETEWHKILSKVQTSINNLWDGKSWVGIY